MAPPDYRAVSLWFDTLPDPVSPRSALSGDRRCDVAIVGAGYTGLWTAYYLKRLRPELQIEIVEAEVAGFGASGRNGGWCTGALAGIEGLLARPEHRAAGVALQRAVFDAVDEVGRVADREGIDCHYRKGGAIHLASTQPQLEQLRELLSSVEGWGFGNDDYRWLEPEEATSRVRTGRCLGALFTPHCAALHPARLVRGLAAVVEAAGVVIHERSPATLIEKGRVTTTGGTLTADLVVRATEGYTRSIAGNGRVLVPIHSMMIATEPLSEETWKEIGLSERETFGDARRMVVYGQRTADGRLAFGARGDYRFGSGIKDFFDADDPVFDAVRDAMVGLLPALRDARITHRWGGALGVPRNWRPAVVLRRDAGLAWAGGYVGQGVAASNLAGRTLAELIVDADTERCRLPWVGAAWPTWEPEPLRWLAVASVTRAGAWADRAELSTGRRSRLAGGLFDAFVAH